jgi:hypothetical protein
MILTILKNESTDGIVNNLIIAILYSDYTCTGQQQKETTTNK